MGHGNIDDIYRRLGKKIDGTTTRAPWNENGCSKESQKITHWSTKKVMP